MGVTTIVPVLMPLSDTTDVQACMYKIFTFTINSFRDFLHLSRRLVEFLMLIQSVLRAKKITWTFLIILAFCYLLSQSSDFNQVVNLSEQRISISLSLAHK